LRSLGQEKHKTQKSTAKRKAPRKGNKTEDVWLVVVVAVVVVSVPFRSAVFFFASDVDKPPFLNL